MELTDNVNGPPEISVTSMSQKQPTSFSKALAIGWAMLEGVVEEKSPTMSSIAGRPNFGALSQITTTTIT
jgi:hypothetical protein